MTLLETACFKEGVYLQKINPAYTSQVGIGKYSFEKKLNRHQAASFVIARRGMGIKGSYHNKQIA